MNDDREWILKMFDDAMSEGDMPKMRGVMEVALQRLYGSYIAVGDRERRLSHVYEVMCGYQQQLEWAWQYVPEEVIREQREQSQRVQDRARDFIQAALDQREFDRITADFDKEQT